MMQPSLFNQPAPREKKRGHVPRTSVEAYHQTDVATRSRTVLAWLREWDTRAAHDQVPALWPTSAELAQFALPTGLVQLLYIRRGLSDLLATGAVQHAASRRCRVSGRTCLTWRTTGR